MSDVGKKVSEMSAATSLSDTDVIPVVSGAVNKKVTYGKLKEGFAQETIAATTTAWLEENVTGGESVVVDASLTISGAAADAAVTGTELAKRFQYIRALDAGEYLSDLKTIGAYRWISSRKPEDSPTDGAGMMLYFGGNNATSNAAQVVVNTVGKLYARWLGSSGWTGWKEFALASDIAAFPDAGTIPHVASFDNVTALADQTVNTLCRLTNLGRAEEGDTPVAGSTVTDFPEGVDLSDGSVAWLHTIGGSNKQQILYYPSNKCIYQRLYHSSQSRWTAWEGGSTGNQMNILVIGNSFNQDVMAYVPSILKEIAPDVDFTIAVLYADGADFDTHIDKWENAGTYALNLWKPSSKRWGRWNAKTLQEVLAMANWDVILTQATSTDVLTAERIQSKIITPGRQLLRILQANAPKPFRAGWFQWIGRPEGAYTSAQMTQKIMNATQTVMQKLGFFDYIPVGAAIQSARTNQTLEALGRTGDMLWDNKHLAAGLPDLIAAYTIAMKIMEWSGKGQRGVFSSDFVPTYTKAISIKASYADVQPGDSILMTHGWPVGVTTTNYLGNKDTAAELPATGNTELDMWYAKDTKLAYVWNGIAWVAWDDDDCDEYVIHENIRAAQEIAELAVRNPNTVIDCSDILEE